MGPGENRDFCRENVETLRTAFPEILRHHFLMLSDFVPKMAETIKASLSESLADKTEIDLSLS
jgi:hypothetical protein